MLRSVLSRLSSSRLRILNGSSFRRHRRTIDAQGASQRIACCDGVQRRDLLETLGPLHRLIHLRKPLHLLRSERLAGTCSSHRVAVDGAVGRVWGRGGERTGGGGACDRNVDGEGIGEGGRG